MNVNHVFSTDVKSKIFDDIMGYFEQFKDESFQYASSVSPQAGSVLRHYHRPNCEEQLINPCVVTVHHDLNDTDQWLSFDQFEAHYRNADLVICLNQSQVDFLNSKEIYHTTVIPHGFNKKFLRLKSEPTEKPKITIGFFSKRYGRKVKGEAYLFELAKRLDPSKFDFILIGNGRNIEARFLRGLGFETVCHQSCPYPVMCKMYHEIDLLLMSSLYEGGPASIPEALATGTPVFTTPIGMAKDMIIEGENGYFLSGDPDQDLSLFTDYQENLQLRQDLYKHMASDSTASFSWEANIKKHEAKYRSVISNTLSQ